MKKLLSFLTFILILNILAGAGLVGYLLATGRLDKQKSLAILDLLKHPGTPDNLRDQVNEVLYPVSLATTQPATAPSTQPATVESPAADATLASLATAQERIDYARHTVEQERLRLEDETRNLLARQKMLDDQRLAVTAQINQLTTEKKNFDQQVQTTATRLKDENFQRTVALYNDLKPKQVKDLLMPLDPSLVADYFRAFDPDSTTKIIAEFKSPAEKQYISGVLEKIRTAGTPTANTPSEPSTQPGAANAQAKE